MPPTKLLCLQSPATATFLSKMGYPRTFPHMATYTAEDRSGLRFRHLGHEQGIQKCLQIIKHIRANTTIGQVYETMLAHYQLTSRLAHPALEDTRPIPWSAAKWIDQLREFLHTIQGSISLCNPWHPLLRRHHDRFIMEDVLNAQVPKKQALQIQHVQNFLKVTALSDIVDHRGTSILSVMLYPAPAAHYE